jgi:hypothetical protein
MNKMKAALSVSIEEYNSTFWQRRGIQEQLRSLGKGRIMVLDNL